MLGGHAGDGRIQAALAANWTELEWPSLEACRDLPLQDSLLDTHCPSYLILNF